MKNSINQDRSSSQRNRPPTALSDKSRERPSFAGGLSQGSPGDPIDVDEEQEEPLKFKRANIPSLAKPQNKGRSHFSTPAKSQNKGTNSAPPIVEISDDEDDDASTPKASGGGQRDRRAPSKGFSGTIRGSSSNSRQSLMALIAARQKTSPTTTSSQTLKTPISPVINNAKHPRKSQPIPNPTLALQREKENVGEPDVESRPSLGTDHRDRVVVNESRPSFKTDNGESVATEDHSPVSDTASDKKREVEYDAIDNSGNPLELRRDGYHRISIPKSSSLEALDEQSLQDSPIEPEDGAPGPTNNSGMHHSQTEKQSDAALLAPWPQCSACKKAGITCDGESPCAACGDPLDCNNPTKSPVQASTTCRNISPPAIVHDYLDPGLEVDEDSSEFESDAESVCEISFNLDFFEQQVRTFEKQMLDYQEYRVHRILEQEGTGARHAPGPLLEPQQSSPFAKLQPQMKQQGNKFCVQVTDGPLGVRANKPLTKQFESNIITVTSEVVSLPRYRSIGRVGPFPLTKNVTIGKSLPYFPDDDKLSQQEVKKRYQELEDKYQSFEKFADSVVSQRRCAEVCAMWRPFLSDLVQKLGIDCLCLAKFFNTEDDYQLDSKDSSRDTADVKVAELLPICTRAQNTICKKCDPHDKLYVEPPWVYQSLWDEAKKDVMLSTRQYIIAGLLSDAFRKVTDIKLWHVIKGNDTLEESLESIIRLKREGALQTAGTLCLVCGLNKCPSHGSYQESDDTDKNTVAINDPEDTSNIHTMVVRTRRTPKHVCGVFCTEGLGPIGITLRGLHPDGTIRGDFRIEMENLRSTYDPKVPCSDDCFWNVEKRKAFFQLQNRPNSKRDLTVDQQQAFENCLELFLGSERGPCQAKDFVSGVSCMNIFFLILDELKATRHLPPNPGIPGPKSTGSLQKSRKASSKHKAMPTKTNQPMFLPCDHEGPCQDNILCSCFQNDLNCEYICGCDMTCDRRYRGCSCRAGRTKVCIEYTCECWAAGRECDPWLCGTCGVTEVLDPANKYRPEIRVARCMQNRLQLGLPARTIKAPSEVQGYGLFAGEDIPESGFIGEYRGEIISHTEADRRGATYHLCGYEYLFTLNEDQEIDASNFGNKTRFMNNSSLASNINVKGATLTCSGVQRVMLSAKRNIKAGEELLYDYSYPDAVRAQFWERGQQLPTKNAMTVAPGRKRTIRKGGKMKGVVDSDDDGSRPPVRARKRKWKEEDDNVSDMDAPLPVIEATDESDYEYTADKLAVESESEESQLSIVESSSSEDETHDGEAQRKGRKPKRAVKPGDKRFGGAAQRKAAVTRKKKLGLL